MMTIEEMQKRKKELNFSYMKISELSGVPYATVQKVLGGITPSPRYRTLRALERVLAPETKFAAASQECVKTTQAFSEEKYINFVRETKQPDYLNVKEEWLDEKACGRIPVGAESSCISAQLCRQFVSQLKEKKIMAGVFLFPFPVLPEPGEKTIFLPDVCVVTDREKVKRKKIRGVPDLVVDIMPADPDTDLLFRKLDKYRKNGTLEYWCITIKTQNICVFDFKGTVLMQNYSFHDALPLSMEKEELIIDFAEVNRVLEWMNG